MIQIVSAIRASNGVAKFSFRCGISCIKPSLSLIVFAFAINCISTQSQAHEIAIELCTAAESLIKSLDETQTEKLVLKFDDELRTNWQFIPMERQGLGFFDMKPNQRLLAISLLQTGLSHRGFSQSMQIMALEQVLHDLENQNPKRDSEKYHLFIFGTPSNTETWGWRIEGHHLSVSFTIVEGKTVVSTPAFFGANPGEVRTGPAAGLRVLAAEEDLGRLLIKNLSVKQKESAILNEPAPPDVVNGPGRAATPLEPAGIAASELDAGQQSMLRELIDVHVKKSRSELAAEAWQKIEAAGFEKIHFAWSGELQPNKPHYYRVQGPTFIIEYDNTQNDANHVHTVWRDFKNDFGADLLQQHYQSIPHGK